jgi:hypothetical protein
VLVCCAAQKKNGRASTRKKGARAVKGSGCLEYGTAFDLSAANTNNNILNMNMVQTKNMLDDKPLPVF